MLGALGADVVKVESIQRPDGMRFTSAKPASVDRWWSGASCSTGQRQQALGHLDLNRPEGRDLVLRLIADADAWWSRTSPRVMENFGLGWDAIHAANRAR